LLLIFDLQSGQFATPLHYIVPAWGKRKKYTIRSTYCKRTVVLSFIPSQMLFIINRQERLTKLEVNGITRKIVCRNIGKLTKSFKNSKW